MRPAAIAPIRAADALQLPRFHLTSSPIDIWPDDRAVSPLLTGARSDTFPNIDNAAFVRDIASD
jgi:hypothetical protein